MDWTVRLCFETRSCVARCGSALQIIVANPKTAGVARWIFLALWGSKMKKGDAAAIEYVTKVRQACDHGCMDAHSWPHLTCIPVDCSLYLVPCFHAMSAHLPCVTK